MVTASPKSGRPMFLTPIAAGFPMCTGPPWTEVYREVIRTAGTTLSGGIGRMVTTSVPLKIPAALQGMSVIYMGTFFPSSMWRTGIPARMSASSKE